MIMKLRVILSKKNCDIFLYHSYCKLLDALFQWFGGGCSSVVACWATESRVDRSILLWGMFHPKIHLISPGCPRPNSAFTVQNSGLKHRSSIHLFVPMVIIVCLFLFHIILVAYYCASNDMYIRTECVIFIFWNTIEL